jgi:hypothetical protein
VLKYLAAQPWWMDADEAELDLLVHEFVKAALRHFEGCAVCRTGWPWCEPLCEARVAVFEWREGRILRSKAEWLRLRQELAS